MPEIDIILPTYNQGNFLDRAIGAILNQSFKDFKFIIVNDGSQDDTSKKLATYNGNDERLLIIDNKQNKGLPAVLNIGHAAGTSPYCTWVSTDNISYPNQMQKLLDGIKSGGFDFVQSRWYVEHPRRGRLPTTIVDCKDNWGYANLCPSFLYKREVWETYHYDENMLCCEDLKFYLQAYLHPFKFGHIDDYLMEYYVQPNSLTFRGNPKRGHQEMLNEIYKTVVRPHELRNQK